MSLQTIRDLSCAGMQISIGGIIIDDFIDDESPVEFSDCEVSNVEFSCNGHMVRTAKPTPIMMSVTVIPGSLSDAYLYRMWEQYHICHKDDPIGANITIPNDTMKLKMYNFQNGTMVSAPPGPSPSNEGKARGRTYTFAFERPM